VTSSDIVFIPVTTVSCLQAARRAPSRWIASRGITSSCRHLELPEYDVMLAEGLSAESVLDMQDRSDYANGPGPIRLYPDFSARLSEAFGCARLVVTGPEPVAARALVDHCTATRAAA
jgi:hypothetical protein